MNSIGNTTILLYYTMVVFYPYTWEHSSQYNNCTIFHHYICEYYRQHNNTTIHYYILYYGCISSLYIIQHYSQYNNRTVFHPYEQQYFYTILWLHFIPILENTISQYNKCTIFHPYGWKHYRQQYYNTLLWLYFLPLHELKSIQQQQYNVVCIIAIKCGNSDLKHNGNYCTTMTVKPRERQTM